MRYALDLPNMGPFADPRLLIDLAREAERAGWDGFFLWDHIGGREPNLPLVEPWIALAAIAATTERIRFGMMVTPLPRRRPWKLARETVSLDRLSGGRLILGVGLGSGRPTEWESFGEETDPRRRGAMLDEGLAVLDGLWSAELFTARGAHYTVEGAHFLPGPVQQPRIPVWVAGYWPNKAPFRRGARWDGMFPLFPDADEAALLSAFREAVAFLREQRGDNLAAFDILHRGTTPGDDPERAAAQVAPFAAAGATWWSEAIHPQRFGVDWGGVWPVEALRERIRQGPPRV